MTEVEKTNQALRPTVRVYACGGAGVNLGQELKEYRSSDINEMQYSKFDVSFVDTSKQNFIGKDIDVDKEAYVFLGGRSDGSGQIRKVNYELIKNNIGDVFKKFPPADINIMLFSMSGGSGSVIVPMLAKDLISTGRSTILIGVGSIDTLRFVSNTKDTLETLQGISRATGRPVILNYIENKPNWAEASTNLNIIFNIANIALLLSGAADRIDSTDINNWLNYDRVSTQPPTLTGLTILQDGMDVPNGTNPFAAMSVHRNDDTPIRTEELDFRKIGYLDSLPTGVESIHFFLDKPSIQGIYNHLDEQVQRLHKLSEERNMDFSFGTDTNDDGFVL